MNESPLKTTLNQMGIRSYLYFQSSIHNMSATVSAAGD